MMEERNKALHITSSCLPFSTSGEGGLPSLPLKSDNKNDVVISMDQEDIAKDPNWQNLPNEMEQSCRLTENILEKTGSDFIDDNESSCILNEDSPAIISPEIIDQQYSTDQLDYEEPFSSEIEEMDITNTERTDQNKL